MRLFARVVHVLAWIILAPSLALAQASFTGTVRDTSGAVLPGVTVEVTSPALIEKVRTDVTDASGQYRIVDLRPGTYSLTFTLPGFSTSRRDGVEISGAATLTINAEMRVGGLEETITVTGESPIVDVQSVRRQVVVDGEVIKDLPAARSYAGIMMLIPSTTTQAGANLDVQVTPGMLVFGGAGGRNNEARIHVDGLTTGAAFNGAGVSSYVVDIGNAQEIALTTSGGLGEAEVGGPSFSVVPKTGGNQLKGSYYHSVVSDWMVGDNYTDDLRARGLTTPGGLTKLWDYNLGIGGPVRKDAIWFFFQFRDEGSHRTVPGMFANANAGDPTKWTYVADRSRPAAQAGSWRNAALRLTLQPTPRNKFNVFWDEQQPCQGAAALGSDEGCRQSGPGEVICGAPGSSNPSCSATSAPETGTYLHPYGQRVQQATWTSPVTNRLLLEGGFGTYFSRWGGSEQPGHQTRDLVRVTEQCTAGCPANGNIANLTYRSQNWSANWMGTHTWRASMSIVSGAQSMKFGYQGGFLVDKRKPFSNNHDISIRVNNAIPNQITQNINQVQTSQRVRYDAFYAQDAWTKGRMTLQGALRFDRAWSAFPEVTIGPTRFLPTAVTYPATDGVKSYKDITPRVGVAYDVFGNSKTAVKINAGRYLQAAQNGLSYAAGRPSGRLTTSVTRTWTDRDADYNIDCNLHDPLAQTTTVDFCGQISTLNFGRDVFTSDLAPELKSGWGVRPGDWQFGASIQQQILSRVSAEIGYNRRWLDNFTVVDNLLQAAGDFGTFSITAPNDARLPEEARGRVISGLYNANGNVASLRNDLTTLARNYGSQSSVYNGVLINITARPRNGLTFQGGVSTGATVTDDCEVRALLPETAPTNPWCNTSTGLVTRYTGLGSYTLPKVDVLVAGTFRSDQGGQLAANWAVSNALVQPSLGRPLSNNATSVTVNLVEPGTLYGDRVNELDVRFAKILRFGRTRTNIGFDIYNVLNSAAVLNYNQAFIPGGNWLVPTGVIQPRFLKFSAQIDF